MTPLPPRLRRLTFNSLAVLRLLAAQNDAAPYTQRALAAELQLRNGLHRELGSLLTFGYVARTRLPPLANAPRGVGRRYHYRVTAEGQRARLDFARALLGDVL